MWQGNWSLPHPHILCQNCQQAQNWTTSRWIYTLKKHTIITLNVIILVLHIALKKIIKLFCFSGSEINSGQAVSAQSIDRSSAPKRLNPRWQKKKAKNCSNVQSKCSINLYINKVCLTMYEIILTSILNLVWFFFNLFCSLNIGFIAFPLVDCNLLQFYIHQQIL